MQFIDKLAMKAAPKSPSENELIVMEWADADSLLFLHLDVSGSPRIKRFARLKFDATMTDTDRRSAYAQFLKPVSQKNNPKTILTWSEGMTFRQIKLPAMPQEDLLKALDWELKKKFYFNGEENLLGYSEVMDVEGDEGPERLYNVFYCENKTALPRLDLAFSLGLQVQALTPGPVALVGFVSAVEKVTDKDILVCELRDNAARIVAARGMNVMLVRNITLTIPDGVWTDDVLGRVAEEVRKTVDFYEGQKHSRPLGKVFFVGERCESARILDFMTPKIGIPVVAPPLENFLSGALDPADKESVLSQQGLFASSLGASLVPEDSPNLVPADVKVKNRQGRVNRLLNFGLIGFGLLLLLIISATAVQLKWTGAHLKTMRVEFEKLNENKKVLESVLKRSRVRRSALKGSVPLYALLKDLSLRTPGVIVLRQMQYSRQDSTLVLLGDIPEVKKDSAKTVQQFATSLAESLFFSSATVISSQEDESTRRFKFEIDTSVKGLTT